MVRKWNQRRQVPPFSISRSENGLQSQISLTRQSHKSCFVFLRSDHFRRGPKNRDFFSRCAAIAVGNRTKTQIRSLSKETKKRLYAFFQDVFNINCLFNASRARTHTNAFEP
jgi:hypothetical protein